MPTYAQLQGESVWGQEIVTDELGWLVDELCAHFGVPRGNGGIKGDNKHLNGGHRSQAWIKRSKYCTNRTYTFEASLTAEQERDLAAFDVTLPLQHMLTISRNADRATRAGELEELVEWFGNVDGDQRVDGWNNIENRAASSDSSHLWHFHGRIRRSLLRDMNTMRRVFAALTGGADDMNLSDPNPFGAKPAQFTTEPGYGTGPWLGGTVGNQLQYIREDSHFARQAAIRAATESTALRTVIQQLVAIIEAGKGSVVAGEILAGVDERLKRLAAEQRDAVADLGEGGAAQVRAGIPAV